VKEFISITHAEGKTITGGDSPTILERGKKRWPLQKDPVKRKAPQRVAALGKKSDEEGNLRGQ